MKIITPLILGCALISAPAMATPDQHETEVTASVETTKNIVEVASEAGSFETLLAAATAAGLAPTLSGDGPFTVFAPTDEAFAALPEGTVASLLEPRNADKLVAILKMHVIAGSAVTSDQLAGKTLDVETLNGTVSVDATDGVTVNNATVTAADIKASNGVIHVIDTVLLPAAEPEGHGS